MLENILNRFQSKLAGLLFIYPLKKKPLASFATLVSCVLQYPVFRKHFNLYVYVLTL